MRPAPTEGTRWLLPGEGKGSSVAELLDASGEGSTRPGDAKIRTQLLLTGLPMTPNDHRRIKDAVQWARGEAYQ